MGKGGHGHGGRHGGGHHFGGRGHHFGGREHHHSRGGRGGPNQALSLEASMDFIHNSVTPPTLINGIYSFSGSEMSFRAQVDQPLSFLQEQGLLQQQQQLNQLNQLIEGEISAQQFNPPNQPANQQMFQKNTPVQQMSPLQDNTPIQQINITLVGNKTKPSNSCCFVSTFFLGACLFFPFIFMCCMWWKKIVYPMYELSVQTFRDIGSFIQRNPNANNLNLTVVDNAFNAEKAGIIQDILSRSHITAFTFLNEALDCNGQHNEADDFRNNMQPIKSLTNVASSIRWGQMIV